MLVGGIGGSLGALTGSALEAYYGSQFVEALGPFVVGARIGFASSFGAAITSEYIKWATGKEDIYFKDAGGRIILATFLGAVSGGSLLKLKYVMSPPTTRSLMIVRTVRIPEFPGFTEIIVPHGVVIKAAVTGGTAVGQFAGQIFYKALKQVLEEKIFHE